MGIFSRLKTGFGMARRSGRVLRAHPKLLVFPLVGGLAGVAFLVTLFGSLFLTGSVLDEPGPALYGALFLAYLVETFLAAFFSAALVAATRTAFHGEDPSIRAALAAAWERKLPLLAWSVVAAIVGVIIRAIESEDNIIARLLAGVFAVAWSVMTYFVVPVIVFRDPSLTGMFKESASTFKNTWGESIGSMATIDIVTVLLTLGGVALGALTFVLTTGLGSVQLFATLLVGGTAVLMALLVGKALTGVAKTALYVYATEQTAPEHFEDMDFGKLGGDDSASTGRLSGGFGGRGGV
jgi:MFS family permease